MSEQPSIKALKILESFKEAVAQELEKNVAWGTTLCSGKTVRLFVLEKMHLRNIPQKMTTANL